jgi:hypothetical protein
MGRFSGMEISSSQGLKNPQKLAYGPWKDEIFFLRANFCGFFNPWDEKNFIPENHGPFGNCIPVGVNQAILCFNLTSFSKNSMLIKTFVK